MDGQQPSIVEVERVDREVLITFADGRMAVYSPRLLYSMLPQARELTGIVEEESDPL